MVTSTQYADKFGIQPGTVRYWCRTGYIKAQKVGRDWIIENPENAPPLRHGRKPTGNPLAPKKHRSFEQLKTIEKECLLCGKKCLMHPTQIYCSKQCAHKSKTIKALTEFKCDWCGKAFMRVKGKLISKGEKKLPHAFCSKECFHSFRITKITRSVAVRCEQCRKEMVIPVSRAKRQNKHFCSIQCRADYIVGPNNPAYTCGESHAQKYGVTWKRQRKECIKRDNNTCQHCGEVGTVEKPLHVHHIIAARHFKEDRRLAHHLNNLITLCHPCHKKAEFGKIVIHPKH